MAGARWRFHVRWADMDGNAHMRNTAYLDLAADVRMLHFQACGFPMAEFTRQGIGPVIQKDEVEYRREMHLLEALDVSLELAGLDAAGYRFRLRNEFFREDGRLAARVTSTGGWLDLAGRRLVRAPDALAAVLQDLPRSEDFTELPGPAPSSE